MASQSTKKIREVVRMAAYGGKRGLPTAAELDALGVPPALKAVIKDACAGLAATHATGDHQAAWVEADDWAGRIIDALPENWEAPEAPDAYQGLGPAELARLARGEV